MQQEDWHTVDSPQAEFTKKLALNFDRFNIVPNHDIIIDHNANSHSDNETDTIYINYKQNNEPTIYQSSYNSSDNSAIPPLFPLFVMDQSKEEINQESSADKKATWEKNASTNGPSTPFLGSYETLNTKKGTNLEQFEKNCMKDPRPFSFAFPSSLTSTSTNENRGIQPSSKKNKGKEPENPDSRKTLEDAKTKLTLTEHKQPPLQTNYDDIKPAITKGNLAKCFQTQEDFLAGIYLEIEKQQSITECFKLKSLDLSRQKITALNDIGLYFPVLEKLKISHNELTQLTGLPDSITYLQADDNKLSSIELAHLSKLQGLYLSHNHLSQFEHLSELKSLRKLDIGHNFIKSVKPFQPLDGLTHLYLNSNNLQRLKEFEEFANRDLEYLDLSFNRIESLDSIEPLSGLIELNADHNDIKMVQLARPLGRLCKLRLSFNRLKSFDISIFPEIRVLYLDDNQIERIMGAACIKRLESFSLRDQGRTKVDINIRYLRGARKLYLSGSPFQNLQYMIDFYSLTYLELCAADIEDLPPQFSKQMPNLATLYLSSNRIADIRPLRKLKYLQRLVLIDNRITGINEAISVVRQLKSLKYLDMRQNPASVNFYNPLSLSVLKGDCRLHSESINAGGQIAISPYVTAAIDSEWQTQDEAFLLSLSDHFKLRRKVYRSLLIVGCPKLIELDHIQIYDLERSQAPDIIQEYSSYQNSNLASSSHEYLD